MLFNTLSLFLVLPLLAQADVVGKVRDAPCAADHREFCPKEKNHTKSFVECMTKHEDKLRPECLEKVKKMQDKLQGVVDANKQRREACSDDFYKLCQGVDFEEEARNACLHKHARQLSEGCATAMKGKR